VFSPSYCILLLSLKDIIVYDKLNLLAQDKDNILQFFEHKTKKNEKVLLLVTF